MGMTAAGWLTQREYTGMDEKAKAFAKDGSFRDDVLSWLPQKADEMTWTALWEAVKRETASKHGNLIGSDAFMQKVAERFDEVVDYTQVYDSVLSRSEVMRSQSALAQMVTSFMAEPTTAYNMLLDSIATAKQGHEELRQARTRISGFRRVSSAQQHPQGHGHGGPRR